MRAALLALLAACGTTTSPGAPGGPDAAAIDAPSGSPHGTSGRWVLAYYVGYQIDALPIASIPWTALTHIAMGPMVVAADGTPDLGFDDSHGTGVADAKALASAARSHGVVPLLMLGGANAGANIKLAAAPGNVNGFVTKLLAAMDQLGYAGIDLDWEDAVDLDELIALAQKLRAARPGIVLTYPGGMINGNIQTADPRFATLAQALDQFNVQSYYPSTAVVGQGWDSWFLAPIAGKTGATPIDAEDTLARYAALGIPKAKLGMGTGFYAICYTGGITAPHQATSDTTQIVGGDNNYPLSAFYASGGTFDTHAGARKRDDVAKQPYLTFGQAINDGHCGAATQYISYEDEQSIMDKGTFAKQSGYGGIIVWTLAEGYLPANASGGRARDAMIQALANAFTR
ncbi:MAG TPA: glycoside hydrolase family 18 protein [Kofleriaceae bacterium]|nr:glycoside hydrolase family 18 protein [Kofleriaceae bacterium]